MQVHITFDVEIWCNGWHQLDERFPANFDRYIYGRSALGDYALPKTLEILNRHHLQAVFFIETLFAARFGERYLREVVELVDGAGHDVQLHVHPEWTDEIQPPLIPRRGGKRQHLSAYGVDEQAALIGWGKQALEQILLKPVTAFRAGSYAANRDTFRALEKVGIRIDSSLNETSDVSIVDMHRPDNYQSAQRVGDVWSYPVTVFRDGFGRIRPTQINGCSFNEMRDALVSAERQGVKHFVIVSHNFEMLRPGSNLPDQLVVRRFEQLCAWLAVNSDRFQVAPFPTLPQLGQERRPESGMVSTARRHLEQIFRRMR
jgi:peptidoglycan/xylan/chitin deacetylase (PgdA/CDA1 family)